MLPYDLESSIAEGEQAVQDLFAFVRKHAKRLEVHEAEKQVFKMLLPIGLAAMKAYFATRGTGDVGPSVSRENGLVLERESKLRERDYFSVFGKFDVPRTCYRAPREESVFPLDEQVNLPARCYSYFLQEWMTLFAVEQPFRETGTLFQDLFHLDIAESVVIQVSLEAQDNYDEFYEARTSPPGSPEQILAVGFDGKGVPMIKEEAVKLKAKLGSGEKRQRKKEALVGVCYTVDPKSRTAEDLAEYLVEPEKARERRKAQGVPDEDPRAENVRRIASLVRSKEEVMETIRVDAESRDPEHKLHLAVLLDGDLKLWSLVRNRFRAWRNVSYIADIMHVVGYLWLAANALFPAESPEGRAWVQSKLTAILQGQVGYVIGALKIISGKRRLSQSKRKALADATRYFTNHRRWMRYDEYLAAGLPISTGVVESACGSLVKPRMEGSGRRWSVIGAEAVLALRSLKKSHGNDLREYWPFRAEQERCRLYEQATPWRPNAHLRAVA
jgi:hypothetical protein